MQQPDGIEHQRSRARAGEEEVGGREQGVRILARSLFRYLAAQGYQARHIILLTAELIGLVTHAARALKGAPRFSPGVVEDGVEGSR